MGVFNRSSRGRASATNPVRVVSSQPDAPLDGSTVRINVHDSVPDPGAASAAEERVHYLVVLEGVARGKSIRLGVDPITVGRSSPADLVLPDSRVSRRHCEIHVTGDQVFVTDRGSTNGSFVNGERIGGTILLRMGGTLHVGEHVLKHKLWGQRELEEWRRLHEQVESTQEPAEIRIDIDEGQRRLEVRQITDSQYFRGLAAEIDSLRAPDDERTP